jgi:hypothetical protein
VQEPGDPFADTGRNVVVTQLHPYYYFWNPDQHNVADAYLVTAAETTPGITANWRVRAFVICVNHSQSQHIVTASTGYSSSPVKSITAACPKGFAVWGTGAVINPVNGQVVLQVARVSGPGDIARAQAHEDVDGYSGNWGLTAFAVCGGRTAGYSVILAASLARLSESVKTASATCPVGSVLLSAGGALSSAAPESVSLQYAYPSSNAAIANGVENLLTPENWDFVVAAAICAT